jgi:hypothetical protein
MGVRNWAEAKVFFDTHGGRGLSQPPVIAGGDSALPSELSFAPTGIARVGLDLKNGQHLVAVGHPTCHFTQNAVAAIEKDAELEALFGRYAIWVAPQDLKFSADLYREWNKIHPLATLSLVDVRANWPADIDDWSTPTFYFFSDGKLVAEVVGWPKEGNRQKLLDGFRALSVGK